MKILFFCENKYALDILRPLHEYITKHQHKILWYIHSKNITDFEWKNEIKWTDSIQECYDFSPEAIYIPGNIVPYYLPGVKIQLFHGYAAEKKDHWIIRRYFDLYLTQGPYFTKRFTSLSKEYGDFEVVETGWTKQDWIKEHLHFFDSLKLELLKDNNCNEIILYAPTFSPKLTSLGYCKKALEYLLEKKSNSLLLIKLHPLTKKEWILEYKEFAKRNKRIKFIEENNVTKYQLISDIMISDTSSTVYEFLLLNKPVVTINTIAKDIYWTNVTENRNYDDHSFLLKAINKAQENSKELEKRKWILNNYDPHLDGLCCKRIIDATQNYIDKYGVPSKRKLNFWRKYTSIKTFGKIKK